MAQLYLHLKSLVFTLLFTLHVTLSEKDNTRPVFESIKEQDRISNIGQIQNSPGILPYGNPLAGNSKQNARIHAHNQQAMFNAVRMRQHKAQLQRWNKGPQIIDSYMKAYHESQESHQQVLEQQQATLKDKPVTTAPPSRSQGRLTRQRTVQNKKISNPEILPSKEQNEPSSAVNIGQNQRRQLPRRGSFLQHSEPTKITIADAVKKESRSRNHRSYGSSDYHQNLEPSRPKSYNTAGVHLDQGIAINPNGNNGVAQVQGQEPSNLYTAVIPSGTRYAYHKSTQDIHALNSILNRSPSEQLTELNALLNPDKNTQDITKGIPVDFYFYLKDSTKEALTQNLDNLKYTQYPNSYSNAFMPSAPVKEYTPITEEVDDIEDPNQKPKPLTSQTVASTILPEIQTTTTKSNNYYKVEVASQTISAGLKPKHLKQEYYVKEEDDPHYQSLTYGYQPYYKPETDDSKSESYLHHNAEPTGVQHLLEDGTETSAYSEDSLQYAANYEFGYRVRDQDSGNYYGHREAKKGKNTKGSYHVLLPDGRMQLVKYSAGPSGFHADISYDHLQ